MEFTSRRESALKSAEYSMLTSAVPPPVDRYVYFEVFATADEDEAMSYDLVPNNQIFVNNNKQSVSSTF